MSERLTGVHHALFVGSDGEDILAFVRLPGGGFAILRDGVSVGTWEQADRPAALHAYEAMIDGHALPSHPMPFTAEAGAH